MKKWILMISLLAPVHNFVNACNEHDTVSVWYYLRNQSEYEVRLSFDPATHGGNPDDLLIKPDSNQDDAEGYGCSGWFTPYETRATLTAHGNESDFDLAYLYISDSSLFAGRFSYKEFNIKSPTCSCEVRLGEGWDELESFDCTSYIGPMKNLVEVRISCE